MGQSTQSLLLHRAATAASIDQGSVGEGMGQGQGHVYHEMITETSGVEVEASLVAFPDALRCVVVCLFGYRGRLVDRMHA